MDGNHHKLKCHLWENEKKASYGGQSPVGAQFGDQILLSMWKNCPSLWVASLRKAVTSMIVKSAQDYTEMNTAVVPPLYVIIKRTGVKLHE